MLPLALTCIESEKLLFFSSFAPYNAQKHQLKSYDNNKCFGVLKSNNATIVSCHTKNSCLCNKRAKCCSFAYEILADTKRSWVRATLEWDNDILDPNCCRQDYSYDCHLQHTLGLLKCLSVLCSTKCEIIWGLKSYCYIRCHGNHNNNRN